PPLPAPHSAEPTSPASRFRLDAALEHTLDPGQGPRLLGARHRRSGKIALTAEGLARTAPAAPAGLLAAALHRGDFGPRDRASGVGRRPLRPPYRAAFAALVLPSSSPSVGGPP